MAKRDPKRLVEGVVKVVSQSTMYVNVCEAINSSKSTTQDTASIVIKDVPLSTKLLGLDNSTICNLPGHIETITQIITITSARQLRELALASSIDGMFKNILFVIVEELVEQYDGAVEFDLDVAA